MPKASRDTSPQKFSNTMIATLHSFLVLLMEAADDIDPEAGEFNLFLFCFLVAGLAALCILILIGIILGLFAFAAITGIGVASITANAVLSGLICRSPRIGLTVLTLQFGAVIGLIFGMASSVATRWLLSFPPFDLTSMVACGLLGAVLGAFIAWISLSLVVTCFKQVKICLNSARLPKDGLNRENEVTHL